MQKIFLTAEKKDAIVDLKIISDSEYVPVTVMFDASKSSIKDSNVTKFDWDFGDGIKQE
ncbi:MAG: PKD domain-containing protein [Candidatus Peribacteria bacterium]|jgi:PKD repeat protein|nr:PKD domain-containing protein [Candidatus Peribacteria bacterium]